MRASSEDKLKDAIQGDAEVRGQTFSERDVDNATLPLTLELEGQPPSLNDYYSGQHWSKRKKVRDQWHRQVRLQAPDVTIEEYPLSVTCEVYFSDGRSQYDTDNCVAACKLVTDALEEIEVLEGDRPKHIQEVILRSYKHDSEPMVRYRIETMTREDLP